MKLHYEAKEELAGLFAGISDAIRDGEIDFFVENFLNGYVVKANSATGTENFDVNFQVHACLRALEPAWEEDSYLEFLAQQEQERDEAR